MLAYNSKGDPYLPVSDFDHCFGLRTHYHSLYNRRIANADQQEANRLKDVTATELYKYYRSNGFKFSSETIRRWFYLAGLPDAAWNLVQEDHMAATENETRPALTLNNLPQVRKHFGPIARKFSPNPWADYVYEKWIRHVKGYHINTKEVMSLGVAAEEAKTFVLLARLAFKVITADKKKYLNGNKDEICDNLDDECIDAFKKHYEFEILNGQAYRDILEFADYSMALHTVNKVLEFSFSNGGAVADKIASEAVESRKKGLRRK
ncbi:hypothetical protein HK104_010058 [Borealophlyctis nickersoniae]|nr:hypothetical protein HK104_010058 [Borealophlyctis nickersoniae]